MHCLLSSASASPQRAGNSGGVSGVVRALGVLVSEGRVQGPPRGYKEGPHCAAPLQTPANNHVCEKDNYLCDRYVILVREIADRVTTCSYLCFEVLLCSDCPCGLTKATCKDPFVPMPSMLFAPWQAQQSSEMLLEYWCISVVPSEGPEMMNNQSLYQAVRSRLHFSQVAAWWSRSKGASPSYITTRIVSFSEDNLRKFRETPSEHTFPLAACGDGNSIKVTVWALPRVEDVPVLHCPMHPTIEKEDEGTARALTPTKNISSTVTSNNPETLVLPTLVDDRLQTPCTEPGKHHCRCEEEDGCPPSPSLKTNGERKRRRSLPRGPDFVPTVTSTTPSMSTISVLSSVSELSAREHGSFLIGGMNYNDTKYSESGPNHLNGDADAHCKVPQSPFSRHLYFTVEQSDKESLNFDNQINKNGCDNGDAILEKSLSSQLSMQEQESSVEKRYKCSVESSDSVVNDGRPSCDNMPYINWPEKYPKSVNNKQDHLVRWDETGVTADGGPLVFGNSQQPRSSVSTVASMVGHKSMAGINWTTSTISGKQTECGYNEREKLPLHVSGNTLPIVNSHANFLVNPFGESSPFHVSNPGPSTYTSYTVESKSSVPNNELSQFMSKLKFSEETDKAKDEKGILDWISRVPSRVFNVATNNGSTDYKSKTNDNKIEQHNGETLVKSKQNCNLELSQQEFDEVLAVLRTRTPSGRRRTPSRLTKRHEKLERRRDELQREFESNLNAYDYPMHNTVHKTVIADRLGIAKLHGKGNTSNTVRPAQREAMKILSKDARKVVCQQASVWGPWAGQDKFENNSCEKIDKQTAKPTECFYNVTNKADVLLGAILRTSEDPRKGLSDISNGARPRTVLSGESCDSKSYGCMKDAEKAKRKIGEVKPFEDDRLLPSSLNKRISQFKQLFKKEQDKKDWDTLTMQNNHLGDCDDYSSDKILDVSMIEGAPSDYILLRKNPKESRVKRRINFSTFAKAAHSADDTNKSSVADDESHLSTNSVYQNPLFSVINCNEKLRENPLLATNEETVTTESLCSPPKPVKHSTNLKLKIVPGATETDCIDHRETVDDVLMQNRISPALQQHEDCEESEHNEALDRGVPSAIEQEQFRRSFGNAASMVFHSRTGLPLTSSPAPLRRGSCCFDYDSSLNSVSSKRSALFELNTPPSPGAVSLEEGDREAENICEGEETTKRRTPSRGLPHSHALLGSFEESALNGRLEPVSTVHGFTAELGASGSFCPKHRKLPVTVFFYTLGDNDKVSTPYLAHINLGKKGYQVPRSGTIQVTLLNPLGTVVKMFVVMYDLSDMPARSHTFLRQRTWRDKTLRYLIHLRFMSGKSGRIYLHTDIRMIICRKSDVDTASDLGAEPPKELRSFVHGPTNPKFSPRC